jgi:hypothetical protein
MVDLVTDYQGTLDHQLAEPLVVLPLAVLDFLCIHPFTDGNGRVARLLSLLLLYRSGYHVGRYISLERIVEESRGTYYDALERSSRGWHDDSHDVHRWLEYFWGVLIRAYGEFEERVATLKGSKTDQIRAAVSCRVGAFGIADRARCSRCQPRYGPPRAPPDASGRTRPRGRHRPRGEMARGPALTFTQHSPEGPPLRCRSRVASRPSRRWVASLLT